MTDLALTTWLTEHRVGDRVVARVGRRGEELVAEFSEVGTLVARPHELHNHFEPVPGVDVALLEKMQASVISGFLRHLEGKITLHGGAVALGSNAVAFVGPRKSGKSTLAAALCAQENVELVADDTVALELPASADGPVAATPTQRMVWLFPDARRALGVDSQPIGKVAVAVPFAGVERLTVVAIVGLAFDPSVAGPSLRRLRGQEAFSLLSHSAIRFVVDEPKAHEREFIQLQVIAQRCALFELRRPLRLAALNGSVELIRRLLPLLVSGDGS